MTNKVLAFLILVMPLASWSQTRYVVQPGDTVLKIADRTLGATDRKDPRRYKLARKIQAMNPGLKDPNALEPGQTLLLPDSKTQAKSAEAAAKASVADSASSEEASVHSEPVAESPVQAHVTTDVAVVSSSPAPAVSETHASSNPHTTIAPATPAAVLPAASVHAHEEKHANFFFIQPRAQLLEIHATERATKEKVSMKAKSSIGLDLQYGLVLSDTFHMLFQAGVTRTEFDKIHGEEESVSPTVNHTSETLKSFGVGVAYEATQSLHMDLMFVAAERTFLLPEGSSAYDLKALMVPGAELNLSLDLYRGTSNILGISAIGEYLATVAKDGVEYGTAVEPLGALYWKSNFGPDRVNYKATVTYKRGHQETSISEQHEDLTSLGLGLYF